MSQDEKTSISRPMPPVLEDLRKRGIRDGGRALLEYHLESEARNWHAWPGDYVDIEIGLTRIRVDGPVTFAVAGEVRE